MGFDGGEGVRQTSVRIRPSPFCNSPKYKENSVRPVFREPVSSSTIRVQFGDRFGDYLCEGN
jgi:hypothetical protein